MFRNWCENDHLEVKLNAFKCHDMLFQKHITHQMNFIVYLHNK